MRARAAALMILPALLLLTICSADDPESRDAVTAWVAEHALVLDSFDPDMPTGDLAGFREMVEGARVVALGESRHDVHEQFLMKIRLFRYLVEEAGFTVLALEEGLPYGAEIDRYVQGGPGEGGEVLAGAGGWFAWDTEEVLDLLEWMRGWNETAPPERRVRFFGCDVSYPGPGVDEVIEYFGKVDSEYAAGLTPADLGRDLFHDWMWGRSWHNFSALPEEKKTELLGRITSIEIRLEENRDEYIAASSDSAWTWAHRQAFVVREGARMFLTESREEAGTIRDVAMADNTIWFLNEIAPGARAVLWAHNAHVLEDTFFIPDMTPAPLPPQGLHLSRMLGDKYFSVGFSFERGRFNRLKQDGVRTFEPAPEKSVDGVLAAAGPDLFIVDLREAPSDGFVGEWLHGRRRMLGQDVVLSLRPARAFDALLFVREITRTTPNPGALERFLEIRGGR